MDVGDDEQRQAGPDGTGPTTGGEGQGSGGTPPGGAVTGPGARAAGEPSQVEVPSPGGVAAVAAGGAREVGGVEAPAEQWESFGVREDTVGGWRALGFGPFEAALAQGDGYGPESARHMARMLQELAGTWRHVGMASEQGLRWHGAGFQAHEAARLEDQGITLDRALAAGGGHRLAG